jgi:hypothetical protein
LEQTIIISDLYEHLPEYPSVELDELDMRILDMLKSIRDMKLNNCLNNIKADAVTTAMKEVEIIDKYKGFFCYSSSLQKYADKLKRGEL